MNKQQFFTITICLFLFTVSYGEMPDTTNNRVATSEDALYWNNVNEGDYIFFTGNIGEGKEIYAGGTVLNLELSLGKKILIWRGDYRRILMDGSLCENTEEQPTVITNLGGQVRWGYSELENNRRSFEIYNFEHIHLTGKYDPQNQTGNENYKGHNGGKDLANGNFYTKFGLWGNPKWSGYRFNDSFSNIVRISGFKTCKVDYVAATEGGFAGFNIKSDNPSEPGRVKINIQDCFSGWTESEGYYISYSSSAEGQDLTELTFKNNIAAFCGSESFQTDNLCEGTIIENNIAFAGACFFRRPFQDNYQDGLHQFSFVEGGVTVQNNILITGNTLHQIRYKNPGEGRAFPDADKEVIMKNNYYGFARSNISYIWEGDGITPYEVDGNIYGPVSTPSSRDAYNGTQNWSRYFKICNTTNPITFKNIIYPEGRDFYSSTECGTSTKIDTVNLSQEEAPVLQFMNTGFDNDIDYRRITFWSADYQTADKQGQFIPYEEGDIVFFFDEDGNTRFFNCIQSHSGDYDPNTSPEYWQVLDWNGNNLPPLDLRLEDQSFYEQKNMGLTYKDSKTLTTINKNSVIQNLNVFPNPTDGNITVQVPDNLQNSNIKLRITDISGKQIMQRNLVCLEKNLSFNCENLETGFYILELIHDDVHSQARFMIK